MSRAVGGHTLSPVTRVVRARAHGKVNLFLAAGPARDDGFHELVTVFQAVSLADEIAVETQPRYRVDRGRPVVRRMRVTGLDAHRVPRDRSNLAVRAIEALAEEYYRLNPGLWYLPAVNVHLHKGIPTAGGMAGGSADAAAALRAFDAVLAREFTAPGEERLAALAARLGSDVPFTLRGGTALGTGRGERLTPVITRGEYHWVFAVSATGLSTPAVFTKLDELRGRAAGPAGAADPAPVSAALAAGDAAALGAALHNDLEAPALSLRPDLRPVRRAARAVGARAAVVSGSGPTVAFLCRDAAAAAEVAEELTGGNLCRAAFTATGPAPGAHLI